MRRNIAAHVFAFCGPQISAISAALWPPAALLRVTFAAKSGHPVAAFCGDWNAGRIRPALHKMPKAFCAFAALRRMCPFPGGQVWKWAPAALLWIANPLFADLQYQDLGLNDPDPGNMQKQQFLHSIWICILCRPKSGRQRRPARGGFTASRVPVPRFHRVWTRAPDSGIFARIYRKTRLKKPDFALQA